MTAKRFRVLVVDDNPGDRLAYRMALMLNPDRPFEVFEVDDGQAGLDSCRAQLPDCILLDFNMPGMDGLGFLSMLNEEYGCLPCAVVMLTGVGDESVAVRAMKAGTSDYLRKTENIGEILGNAVIGAIEKFRMRLRITEQQLALEASERQYRTLMEALPQLVWLADSTGRIQYANERWRQYSGLTLSADFGVLDFLRPVDRQGFVDTWREAVGANRSFEMELRLRRTPDGADRWHLVRFAPLQEQLNVIRWLGTATDIEEMKQAEIVIQKRQKWESIGMLAGGIAHDFNNLLVGIVGGASLLADSISVTEEERATLGMILRSGERAAQLTRQLLDYSGRGQFFVERVDLPALVKETCDLIRSSIPQRVHISVQAIDTVPIVQADAGQIQQVIISLVMNAVEAIPENQPGKVIVRTFAADCSAKYRTEDQSGPDACAGETCAVLEVQDNGSGMDADTKAKIFDPFFTTKFAGRGLGLAVVQGIMRTTKGRIIVDSAPGVGSTFRVFVPAQPTVAITRAAPSIEVMPERNAVGSILVIDDEPAIRQVIGAGLGRAGYKVLVAPDGPTGLRTLEQQKDSISLVLLDMGMPQMGGEEVPRRMRAAGHRVPVAICSGYSESQVLAQLDGREFSAFIQKPFRINELEHRVRDLLRGVPAQPAGTYAAE